MHYEQEGGTWIEEHYQTGGPTAYFPFVIIGPDVHSQSADGIRLEERERRLGRDHLYRHVLVLLEQRSRGGGAGGRVGKSGGRAGDELSCNRGSLRGLFYFTWRSSATMCGALTDATLPVVMRRTCVSPSRLWAAAVNGPLGMRVESAERNILRPGRHELPDGPNLFQLSHIYL